MGAECEFYLFERDAEGRPTKRPQDNGGYFDVAPLDRGENVRREICLTLEEMNIRPESSHHEQGPGQNEVDFKHAAPLTAADDVITFKNVVKTVAARNGLYGSFSPKPLADKPGSGMHVNISLARGGRNIFAPGRTARTARPCVRSSRACWPARARYAPLRIRFRAAMPGSAASRRRAVWRGATRTAASSSASGRARARVCAHRGAYAGRLVQSLSGLCIAAGSGLRGYGTEDGACRGDAYDLYTANAGALEALPASLEEAIARAGGSAFVEKVLSADTARKYLALKQAEQNRWFGSAG